MNKKKALKNSILLSTLAMTLCVLMLIGTTYAWFTDAIASSGNIIKSGTLKIDVLVKGGDLKTADLDAAGVTSDGGYYSLKSAAEKGVRSPLFNYHLWEPGYTDWANVKVVNDGTLALKYTMRIVPSGTVSALAEVIDVYYAPYEVEKPTNRSLAGLTKIGTLKDVLEGGAGVVINDYLLSKDDAAYAPDFATIALHMQETAGNEYQDLEIGSYFELQIIAGQYTYEVDSFDEYYDADAEFPVLAIDIYGDTPAPEGFHALSAESADVVIADANATSTIAKETTIVSAENEAGAVEMTDSVGELSRIISTSRDEESVTYDISYRYTVSEDGVSTSFAVTEFSTIVTNELFIGKDLKIIKVARSHGETVTEMTALESADIYAEGYYYNHDTGYLTIKSAKYSEFTVLFERKTPVSIVLVEPGSVTLDVGQSADVTSSVLPDDATYKDVVWTSSKPAAVSVDQTGKVTAIQAGVYTVTATADGVSSSCTVTVTADAKIGEVYYANVADAFAAAQDHDTIELLRSTEAGIAIHGVNDLTFQMNGYTLDSITGCAFTLYDCDGVTLKNGVVNGQIRVGEHQRTIVKWKYADQTPIYGYHPLSPAKNVVLEDLTVTAAGTGVFYFTNIEDDLTRANESNPFDQDLYGHYIYKTGYQTYEQSVNAARDEVFTVCNDKDSVTISGGTYTGAAITGKMYDINGSLYTDVLIANGGVFSDDGIGRFVPASKNLVGSASNVFTVSGSAPSDYTGKVNNVYYTYAGGANSAILYANFGETVYIKENADAVKVFGEDENGESEKLTVVYEADGIAYTGGTPANSVYSMKEDDAEIENGHIFYAAFEPVAAVYATSRNGNWKTATKVGDYATLSDAFAALSNDYTVVILKDVTVGDETTYTYGGTKYKCAAGYATRSSIDFNGHRITYTGTGACIVSSQQTGYLYLKDSSGTNAGGITATNGYCFRKENAKSDYTYISGGTYIAEKKEALYLNGGTGITISGGVFTSNSSSAFYTGWKVTAITVTGGTFTAPSGKNAVGYSSKVTIQGGTYSSAPDSRMIASGKSAVENGDGTWTVR